MDEKLVLQVKEVASQVFNVSVTSITEDTKSGDLPQWDSLGHLNFFLALEEKFNIKFSTEEITSLFVIKDIVNKIEEKLNEK